MARSVQAAWLIFALALTVDLRAFAEEVGSGGGDEDPTATPIVEQVAESKSRLGNFVEVIVTKTGEDFTEITGWIRDKARLELLPPGSNVYKQVEDNEANRSHRNAGVRIYYPDGLNGFVWIPYKDIGGIEDVRRISPDEELKREREEEERIARALEEARRAFIAEQEGTGEEEEGEDEEVDPDAAAPENVKYGLKSLEKFPPDWRDEKFRQLRYTQIDRRAVLTAQEREFYDNWEKYLKPAVEWRTQHPVSTGTGGSGTKVPPPKRVTPPPEEGSEGGDGGEGGEGGGEGGGGGGGEGTSGR